MVSLISEEWSRPGGCAFSIVVSKLGNREPMGPVIMLEITVNAEVLFRGLVYSFCLTVCLGMIARSEVQTDSEECAKRTEKVGDKLGTSVRGDMRRDSVFREYILEIKLGHTLRSHFVHRWEEQGLFRQAVHDYQDGGEPK